MTARNEHSTERMHLPLKAVQLLLSLLVLLIISYGVASWYLWAKQRKLIFLPSPDVHQSPANLDLEFEEVWLPVGGSNPAWLHGWWLQSKDAVASVFLYLHGNDLNIGGNVERIARLHRMGFTVLAVDYRGYGKSGGGFPSEIQVYEDAEVAWNYLVEERHVDPRHAFIYGHSMGGAVAISSPYAILRLPGRSSRVRLPRCLRWRGPLTGCFRLIGS